jgi:hypothetical protein
VHVASLDGSEEQLAVRIGREQNTTDIGKARCRLGEEIDAGHPGHAVIRDDDTDVSRAQPSEGRFGRACSLDREQIVEYPHEEIEVGLLVVDNEDAGGLCRHVPVLIRRRSQCGEGARQLSPVATA